jgi:hypothetical protein
LDQLATWVRATLGVIARGIFILVAVALAIHTYESTRFWFFLVYVVLLLWGCLTLFRTKTRASTYRGQLLTFFGVTLWLFFLWCLIGGYGGYLADAWGVELDSETSSILMGPLRVAAYLGEFLSDLIYALAGLRLPAVQPISMPATDVSGAGAIAEWIGASIWSIVLGIVSSAVYAVLQSRQKA